MRERRPSFVMVLILLAACLGGIAVQGQEVVEPSEPEETRPMAAPEPVEDWQAELDEIADLLIDGKPVEAKKRSTELLDTPDLPDPVAARARGLLQKAEEKLAASPGGPEPRRKIEISGEDGKPKTSGTTFNVRLARIGSGFESGMSGLLRISETGLVFSRKGKAKENWTIPWSDLADARQDDGLWDAPYPPVLLLERSGRRHFLVQVDAKGRHLPPGPLLSAIAQGRRRQKQEPAAGNPGEAGAESGR